VGAGLRRMLLFRRALQHLTVSDETTEICGRSKMRTDYPKEALMFRASRDHQSIIRVLILCCAPHPYLTRVKLWHFLDLKSWRLSYQT
jgi:hypothetical protein